MIKHESHLFAVAIDTGNTTPESNHQVLYIGEEHIGQHGAFKVAPETFNQVQAWTIRWQPEHFDLIPMRSEPLVDSLGMMKPPVVTDQTNLLSGIRGYQGNQKDKKILATFGLGHRVNYPAGLVIDQRQSFLPFNDKWNYRFSLRAGKLSGFSLCQGDPDGYG